MTVLWLILPALFWVDSLAAQTGVLQIVWPEGDQEVSKNIEKIDRPTDSVSVYSYLQNLLVELRAEQYLTASVDSLLWENGKATAYLFTGKTYRWRELRNGNVGEEFLSQVRFRERLYEDRPLSETEIRDLQKRLLTYAENNGYPFAQIYLDSIEIEDGAVTARLMMEPGQVYFFDDINLSGNAEISLVYLQSYLGIRSGTPFSRKLLLRIRDRLRELPFLEENRGATVTFRANRATVNLSLKKRKASRFDLVFGFLPGGETINSPGGSNRAGFQFTATGKADWQNQFGRGERIFLEYERIRPRTQELDVLFSYPYVLDLPFGVEGSFDLFKNDTLFLEVGYNFGVQYLFSGGNYLKIFVENETTNLLSFDETAVANGIVPASLDLSNSLFGLELNWLDLDYRYNPRTGYSSRLRAGAGFKTLQENNKLLELNEAIYDGLTLRTFQYRFDADLAGYLPLGARSTLKTGLRGGYLLAPEAPIYRNEQYRIGGNQLLRGFDEESIFTTRYAVLTVEPRLLFSQNGYFYAFADVGYTEDKTDRTDRTDQPIGIGVGLALETPAGILGVSLAVGKTRSAPFNFRAPKIHIGYVSLF